METSKILIRGKFIVIHLNDRKILLRTLLMTVYENCLEEQGERYAAGFNPRAGARMMQETSDRGSFGGPRRDGPSSYGRDRDGPSSFGRDRDGPSSFSRNRDGPSSYGRDRDGPSFSRDALRPSEGRPSAAEAPKERPKLSLKPRSVPLEEGASNDGAEEPNAPAPAPASSANIFGLAKPVDTAARERAIEERLKERERERAEPSRGREMSRPEWVICSSTKLCKSEDFLSLRNILACILYASTVYFICTRMFSKQIFALSFQWLVLIWFHFSLSQSRQGHTRWITWQWKWSLGRQALGWWRWRWRWRKLNCLITLKLPAEVRVFTCKTYSHVTLLRWLEGIIHR